MRKVTQDIVSAFLAGNPRTIGNSHTDGKILFLHGNQIAQKIKRPLGTVELWISNAGWTSNTTKERLNGLLRSAGERFAKCGIWQKNFKWFYSDARGNEQEFPCNELICMGYLD